MERILNIKVDLECPDEAKFAIDKAVEAYESSKRQWTMEEIADAKHIALNIMGNLCWEGDSILWTVTEESAGVSVWNQEGKPTRGICYLFEEQWNIWVAKCVSLCIATGREVPKFITDKAGECW